MKRRLAVAAIVAVLIAGLGLWAWRRKVEATLSEQYASASCLSPFPNPASASFKPRTWDSIVTLSGGVTAKIEAYCFVSGFVRVKYSDEVASRDVTRLRDYVYPCDLRLSREGHRLYVKSEGLGGGIRHEVILHEYDLDARHAVQSVHVSRPLPPECPEVARGNSAG